MSTFPVIDGKEQLRRYRELMGDEATARQVINREKRYPCCWELKAGQHHPDCKQHPKRKAERTYRKYHGDKATEGAS